MDKVLALERLNHDKSYEEKLVADLSDYYISYIDSIPDINRHEKEQLKLKLDIILSDSKKHARLFTELIEFVLENDETHKF